ncbi:DMT family transporter [Streptomyces malaysiensis]|uniref:hypothetical protein n=1 Tax=Streptomyces malaysiensis TaxID=92644 RepID=UPI002B29BF68|nr:hypothetical protein R8789_02250 [Streptomyces malaysiensis]
MAELSLRIVSFPALGTDSALEFLGPLAVSLCDPGRGRRRWTVLAAIGVVALTEPWHGCIAAAGAGFALAAAACWASYILLTQRVGDSVTGLGGLAISMPVAGLIGLIRRPEMSLEPAIALLGLLVLGQIPGLAPAVGVACVVLAGIGATRTGARPTPNAPEPRPTLTSTTPANSPSR